jgi:hypothetical protein
MVLTLRRYKMIEDELYWKPMQILEIIRAYDLNYVRSNALKHLLNSADSKKDALIELKKTLWFIENEIEYLQSKHKR